MGQWTIKNLNNIVADNLILNGNNFISDKIIDLSKIKGKITAFSDENSMKFDNAVGEQTILDEDKFCFIIREKSDEEILQERLTEADVTVCDLYEQLLNLESTSLSQDETLIELYTAVFKV